jgi:TRAP-type uncharacterized transport system fused permease subunit
MNSEKYPYQKQWKTHRLKTASSLIFIIISATAFYIFLKYHKILTRYIAVEIILGFFIALFLFLLVFALHTHFWRCPRCLYQPVIIPFFGKYYERYCVKCGLNKYEGSTYFDGKIKIKIGNL